MSSTELAERLADVDAAQQAGQAVEQRNRTIFDMVRDMRPQFEAALPAFVSPERFTRVALTVLRTNPNLARCSQSSLLGAFMLSAQLGLEPGGPLGHAYLVPFGNECTFIVGYRGYIDLARRSGQIADVYAEAVYDGDEFSWTLGLHRDITHVPSAPDRDDPAKITQVYAVAKYRDGSDPAFVVLTRAQVEKYRARSKAKNNGPWVTDWPAMALKTAMRRLANWLPMTIETAAALAADEKPLNVNQLDDLVIDVEELEVSDAIDPPSASDNGGDGPAPSPAEPVSSAPWDNYDSDNAAYISKRLKSDDIPAALVEHVREYELAHKKRSEVLNTAAAILAAYNAGADE